MFILLIKLCKLKYEYNIISMTFPPKIWDLIILSKTFPGLKITIRKFQDFSRFSMTVQTL